MSKALFRPEQERREPHPRDPRRIYGVSLKPYERLDLDHAVCDAAGIARSDVLRLYGMKLSANSCLKAEHGMRDAFLDDQTIRLCEDLGIDWRKFPHNTPLLPNDGFVELACKRLAGLKRPTNQTQWSIQWHRFNDLWKAWTKGTCDVAACADCFHLYCQDNFEDPDFWKIACVIYAKSQRRVQTGLRLASANGRRVDCMEAQS